MATATTNIELYQRLNTELMSMVDQFTNLVKGTKEGLDADEAARDRPDSAAAAADKQQRDDKLRDKQQRGDRRVPGELLEVLVEKLLAAGHQCVHTISELKKGAIIGDFDTLIANVQDMQGQLQKDAFNINRGLDHIRREAEALLVRLEEHYYSSAHKGGERQQPAAAAAAAQRDPAAATLAELCAQAQAMIDDLQAT